MRLAAAASPERVAVAMILTLLLLVVLIWLPRIAGDPDGRAEPSISPTPSSAAAIQDIVPIVLA